MINKFVGNSFWTRTFYRFIDSYDGDNCEDIRDIEAQVFHQVNYLQNLTLCQYHFQSSKPALSKNALWGNNSPATKCEQREADRNVAGIIYRSLKNQEKKAQKDSLGITQSLFNF